MPKIILTSRYIKNAARANAGKLIRYMGTREGVEKLPEGADDSPATVRQQRLISSILKSLPSTTDYPEYFDYGQKNTKSAASQFIDAVIERNADRIDGIKNLVKYIAERPGVEKISSHGLFSLTDEAIDLDALADDVSGHEGMVWTHVVSLRREDAERLGYNNADAWKRLVRRNVAAIAEAHKIKVSDMEWYAAFHNTEHHPHIHLMVYSNDSRQGYLTKKGIDDLRSLFGNDIFRNEQYKLFELETRLRDELKDEFDQRLNRLLGNAAANFSPTPRLVELVECLAGQLNSCSGQKVYGYLPKEVKATVNAIIAEIASDPSISALYSEWSKVNREKLSLYYDKEKPTVPLEDNREFRSLKNALIRTVMLNEYINASSGYVAQPPSATLSSIVRTLCSLVKASCERKQTKLHGQIDSKLRLQIEQKKAAHGLKTSRDISLDDEDEAEDATQGYGMIMKNNGCNTLLAVHLRCSFRMAAAVIMWYVCHMKGVRSIWTTSSDSYGVENCVPTPSVYPKEVRQSICWQTPWKDIRHCSKKSTKAFAKSLIS